MGGVGDFGVLMWLWCDYEPRLWKTDHGQDKAVATRRSDHGQSYSSVSAGWLDQHSLAWHNSTPPFRSIDHGQADTVLGCKKRRMCKREMRQASGWMLLRSHLHRVGRLHTLKLEKNLGVSRRIQLVEAQERRPTDEFGDAVCDLGMGKER